MVRQMRHICNTALYYTYYKIDIGPIIHTIQITYNTALCSMPTYVIGVAGCGVAEYIPVLPKGQAEHAPLALHVGEEVAAVIGGQVQLLDYLTLQIAYWVYID